MGGLTIVIVTAVFTVITTILLSILIHYNKQSHQCDGDLLFWCYSDWKCFYGTNGPVNKPDGDPTILGVYTDVYDEKGKMKVNLDTVTEPNKMPLKCYTLGMFSKMSEDEDCKKILNNVTTGSLRKYNKFSIDKCSNPPDDDLNEGIDDLYPCGCKALLNPNYGSVMSATTGFFLDSSSKLNEQDSTKGCFNESGDTHSSTNCVTYPSMFCNVIGKQLGSSDTS
jgi:hypothetical protein